MKQNQILGQLQTTLINTPRLKSNFQTAPKSTKRQKWITTPRNENHTLRCIMTNDEI